MTKHHPSSVDLELVKRLIAATTATSLVNFLAREFDQVNKGLAGKCVRRICAAGMCSAWWLALRRCCGPMQDSVSRSGGLGSELEDVVVGNSDMHLGGFHSWSAHYSRTKTHAVVAPSETQWPACQEKHR